MSLTVLAPLNCSALIDGWKPDNLAVNARETVLHILSPHIEVE